MEYVKWVDEERWRACGGEGGGNLGTDMSALADTCDNHLALAVVHQLNSLLEAPVKLLRQPYHGCGFIFEALYR